MGLDTEKCASSAAAQLLGQRSENRLGWQRWVLLSVLVDCRGPVVQVYKALRNGVQPVAVKVLHCPTGKQLAAFRQEISILQSLHDNNVVQFLGVCQLDGRIMLVTEFMQVPALSSRGLLLPTS